MPIFQDDLAASQVPPERPAKTTRPVSPLEAVPMTRKLSEESIRTELCEGPLLDTPEEQRRSPVGTLDTGFAFPIHGTSDRGDFITRLKKGETPTWLPNRNLESLLQEYETPTKSTSNASLSSPLLPSPELSETSQSSSIHTEASQAGLQIERPRSALHSGDFTEGPQRSISGDHGLLQPSSGLYRSDRQEWLATSPPRNFSAFQLDTRFPPADRFEPELGARSRGPSLSSSYSSSFVMKPPTSPLVQSESNEDLELSTSIYPININTDSKRNPRRHTLQASHSMHSTPSVPTASSFSKPLPHLRRDSTYPYQAHQPRRSLTSNPVISSSPQTPNFLRSRRPSYTSDSSPLHASMVGSYEESILRGRMSTTPSKPLDFVAQIGVLGLGKCKSSLRCPPHVTIPFPAVFYSYETTSHSRAGNSEDGPSPYVGQIDLENSLPNLEVRDTKRKRLGTNMSRSRDLDLDLVDGPSTNQLTERELRRAEKQKRRSTSPRAPPGGSYRIPEKGQLQIIIKNPNKTAVKLFLIPYDLAGMEPGTKTFIRQRSYSAGPIIDSALSSSQQSPATNVPDRPTLRYLVHVHVCSPSRGRFYLYKSIRLVFANRVPDGKEKLRNETSLPEPRFSVYKPGRESSLGLALSGGPGASLAAEKAYRRRSSGFALGHSSRNYDAMDGITQALEKGFNGGPAFSQDRDSGSAMPIQPIPFSLYGKSNRNENEVGPDGPSNVQSPTSSKSSRPPTSHEPMMTMSWTSNSDTTSGIGGYDKLNKGDVGYGGNVFASSPDGKHVVAEGLLAKKLRDLGVGVPNQQDRFDGM